MSWKNLFDFSAYTPGNNWLVFAFKLNLLVVVIAFEAIVLVAFYKAVIK